LQAYKIKPKGGVCRYFLQGVNKTDSSADIPLIIKPQFSKPFVHYIVILSFAGMVISVYINAYAIFLLPCRGVDSKRKPSPALAHNLLDY
jgi:hypothetical protein